MFLKSSALNLRLARPLPLMMMVGMGRKITTSSCCFPNDKFAFLQKKPCEAYCHWKNY